MSGSYMFSYFNLHFLQCPAVHMLLFMSCWYAVCADTGAWEFIHHGVQCGGEKAAIAAAEPYLKLMGKNVINCGQAGNGQAAKVFACIPVHAPISTVVMLICRQLVATM